MASLDAEKVLFDEVAASTADPFTIRRRLADLQAYDVTVLDVPDEWLANYISLGWPSVWSYVCGTVSDPHDIFGALYEWSLVDGDSDLCETRFYRSDGAANSVRSFRFRVRSFRAAEYVTKKILRECRLARVSSNVSSWIEPARGDFVGSAASMAPVAPVEPPTGAAAVAAMSCDTDASVPSSAVAATTPNSGHLRDERRDTPIVALVVESTVYVSGVLGSRLDMPLHVSVFDKSRTLYDYAVFCNRGKSFKIDGVGSLALETLENEGVTSRDFDDVTRDLIDLLRDRYVVLYDHLNVFDVLRIELSPVQYFDVGTSRLVRNEALRAEGALWPHTPSTVAPLALLWSPLFGLDVPSFGKALGRGLLEMFNRVRFNLPPIPHLPAPEFELSRSYRSTVYNWLPLESSIAAERVSDPLLRSRVLRSSRPVVLPSVPRPRPSFRFVMAPPRGADPLPFQTLNGLCRALPLAGVAFLRHCVKVQALTIEVVARYVAYQRERPADSLIEEVYPVDFGNRYAAENAVREFLRLEDAEIVELARNVKFAGVGYLDCV